MKWFRESPGYYTCSTEEYNYEIIRGRNGYWVAAYHWKKWTNDDQWARVNVCATLKDAKFACYGHMVKPRRKFKFMGRNGKGQLLWHEQDSRKTVMQITYTAGPEIWD